MNEIFDNLRSPDDKLVNDLDRIIHKAERMYTQAEMDAALQSATERMPECGHPRNCCVAVNDASAVHSGLRTECLWCFEIAKLEKRIAKRMPCGHLLSDWVGAKVTGAEPDGDIFIDGYCRTCAEIAAAGEKAAADFNEMIGKRLAREHLAGAVAQRTADAKACESMRDGYGSSDHKEGCDACAILIRDAPLAPPAQLEQHDAEMWKRGAKEGVEADRQLLTDALGMKWKPGENFRAAWEQLLRDREAAAAFNETGWWKTMLPRISLTHNPIGTCVCVGCKRHAELRVKALEVEAQAAKEPNDAA